MNLRKTQSHTVTKATQSHTVTKAVPSGAKHGHQDEKKSTRCRSIPGPLPPASANPIDLSPATEQSKTSCPNSPLDATKEFNQHDKQKAVDPRKVSAAIAGGLSTNGGPSSPKPKKNIFDGFRNTLRKSKNDGSGVKSPEVYANTDAMPDIVQGSGDSRTTVGNASPQASVDSSSELDQPSPVSVRR